MKEDPYFHVAGSASDPSQVSKDGKNAETPPRSHSQGLGFKVLVICFGVAAVVAFSVFLFKKWQKKKREEQHARLLRLFEEDDELELELGLRD
ncbi:hypothetical protein AMTR_s00071p00195020 [Amborella trichopoda]|uniref:Uncharacterized protein n=1 Tax=Amborella trichopoda TaxID=13333 RepID=U5DF40_AMBTC|nr:hypothetical protein AMTR_s00071p00195020 [Amborella trichopoda]